LVAWNTAVSFMTNTNWQAYAGERTLSDLSQMAALTVQNFLSAATGLATVVALARGLARQSSETLGNVWVDLTRSVLYVLVPLAALLAIVLVWQGVPQTLAGPVLAQTLEGGQQLIVRGPIASQEAIKLLGANGGGFFNANSAHPFENPTALTNVLEILAFLALPASLPIAFGDWVGARRQGWAIWSAMALLFLVGLSSAYVFEAAGNPLWTSIPVEGSGLPGNLEGKELRFGLDGSVLFAVATTAVSCGAVNSAHSSYLPLAGMILVFNMLLGEVVFGGVGVGLAGMLVFVLTAVFIAGLMVGRTPEYLGKKLGPAEIKLVGLYILIASLAVLVLSGLAAALPLARRAVGNPGPHGFTEIVYAYASTVGNNGSAFASLDAAQPFWLWTTGVAMFVGRFPLLLLVIALAGLLARKRRVPPSLGTLPTDSLLFVLTLVGVVVIVGGLTFFPALALGPIIEHILLRIGRLF
ncbi:MAG: potassium-transporting ATPase subunit KdpA, partial [Thermomicrobium sp.]|nr:potassium-transporting ATPase subunit KdpA [Thermomicrobium sp.]MDW8005438.1 potassium-transporting ATPase subunit KdpA [Thermomicrobium sp.]